MFVRELSLGRLVLGIGMLFVVGLITPVASAQLLHGCSSPADLAPYVPSNVTLTSVTDVPAANGNPEFCDVLGSVTTSGFGAPDGLANFEAFLPDNWNQKFLYFGCGGLCGSISLPHPPSASANEALQKGYVMVATDDGHSASDPNWGFTPNVNPTLPGAPKEAALVDYFFRSEHEVAVAVKTLAQNYFSEVISRSYFTGCSDGGREALVEASRFPDDYDGIIAGDPYQTQRDELLHVDAYAAFNKPSIASEIPHALLQFVDQAVYKECDKIDGVADGLIQDPLRCNFDPKTLLCADGATSNCLTQAQVNALKTYWSPLVNEEGQMVLPAWPVSDISPTDPGDFSFTTLYDTPSVFFISAQALIQEVYFTSSFVAEDYPITSGVISDPALALFDQHTWAAGEVDPKALLPFFNGGRKLLLYDGFSDQGLPPYQTVMFYEDLANIFDRSNDNSGRHLGGLSRLRNQARLFMVPGMEHCGGGPGPNVFDTVAPLESWVEGGTPPQSILATHYTNNNPAMAATRTMPLCPFPEQAQYDGSGDVNQASSWSCPSNDKTLYRLGKDGMEAGFLMDRDLLQGQFLQDEDHSGEH
jgi:feruloyl esterase